MQGGIYHEISARLSVNVSNALIVIKQKKLLISLSTMTSFGIRPNLVRKSVRLCGGGGGSAYVKQ